MWHLQNVNTGWLWLLSIAGGGGLLYLAYREIYSRSRRRVTWVLLALRGAGILALLLALARPVKTDDTLLVDPGRLAVIVDNSRSMSLGHTGGKSRFELAREAAETLKAQVEGGEGPQVRVEFFDINGEPYLEGVLPAEARLESTDLVRAVAGVESRLRSRELLGIVLVTDGMDNSGREDVLQLADSDTPIHAIGFPSDPSSAGLDLALRDPQAPEQVLVNNKVTVRVPVARVEGPDEVVPVTVTVTLGDQEQARAEVTLAKGENQVEAVLTFEPNVAGRFMYRVTATTTVGERVEQNNVRQFAMQVNAEAIGVLYLEGFLRFEYAFLRKRLNDDPDISLVTVIRSANPDRPDPAGATVLVTPERLDNVHLVILGDMEADFLAESEYEALKGWVQEEGHALLVLGGYRSFGPNGFVTTPLADVLPVVFVAAGQVAQSDERFTMDLTAEGSAHPIFQVRSDRLENKKLWAEAAQLEGCSLVQRAKPGAVVFAENPVVSVDGQNAVVIATHNYGSGKAMVVTADTTWKWSREARLVRGQSDELYARFWSQAIRWLTGRSLDDRQAPLVVTTDRPGYPDGEPVQVRVVQRGEAEAGGQTVAARIVDSAGQEQALPLGPARDGSGDLVATVYPRGSGRHVIHAVTNRGGKVVANENVEFLVYGSDFEVQDTRTNHQLLRQVAAERGAGVYVDIDKAATLADQLGDRRERIVTRSQDPREYWNSPFLFTFFLAAVTGEWWIRRRNRLV